MKKVKATRWRPSLGVVRGLQIEISSLQTVIAKGATDRAREMEDARAALGQALDDHAELQEEIAELRIELVRERNTRDEMIRAVQMRGGWWSRFFSLFGL